MSLLKLSALWVWAIVQNTLVSGTTPKTVNGNNLLGAGVQVNGSVAGTFTLGAQYSVVTLKRKAPNLWTLFW